MVAGYGLLLFGAVTAALDDRRGPQHHCARSSRRVLMERIAFRPVRNSSPTTMLITSFAVSTLLQNVALADDLAAAAGAALAEHLRRELHASAVSGSRSSI